MTSATAGRRRVVARRRSRGTLPDCDEQPDGPHDRAPRRRPAARPAARRRRPRDLAAPRRGPGRLGRRRRDPDARARPVRRRRQVVDRDVRRAPWSATRSASPAPAWSASARFALRRRAGRPRAGRPARSSSAAAAAAPGSPRSASATIGAADAGPASRAGRARRRGLRRRRARRRATGMAVVADAVAPDRRRRPGEGRAGPRPGRHRRRAASTCAGRCAGSPTSYPMCWTFHVDGLFGATPEMLVRRERGLVTSRVLAGTIRRTGDDERDLALAATLARSSKDLEEHEYAVRSVADALEPHCSSMNVPEAPFVLHLPNVMHLATDVAGVVHDAGDRHRRSTSPRRCTRRRPSAARPTDGGGRADRRDRGHGPRPLRRPGRLDGRHRRRRVGHRAALGRARRRHASGCSPAAASSPTPTPRPSSPRRRRSSSRSATRSRQADRVRGSPRLSVAHVHRHPGPR